MNQTFKRKAPNREIPTFSDYEKLINSVSWKWHCKTGWEYDELIAEGNLVFVKVSKDYIPEKSKFSARLGYFLEQHFQNLLNTSRTQKRFGTSCELDETFFKSNLDEESIVTFFDLLKELPEDSKEVVKAIYDTPAEILEVLEITRISQSAIYRYFTEIKGWGQTRTANAFQEIKNVL